MEKKLGNLVVKKQGILEVDDGGVRVDSFHLPKTMSVKRSLINSGQINKKFAHL